MTATGGRLAATLELLPTLELEVVVTELLLAVEQTPPVIVGFSAGTPLVSP